MNDHITLEPRGFAPNPAPEGEIRIWLGSDGNLYKRIGSQAQALLISGGGGGAPTGAAGGDLGGTYPNPTALKTGGVPFGDSATRNVGIGTDDVASGDEPVAIALVTALDEEVAARQDADSALAGDIQTAQTSADNADALAVTAFDNAATAQIDASAALDELSDQDLRISAVAEGGVVFPDADPHIAGAGYWTAGVLTESTG